MSREEADIDPHRDMERLRARIAELERERDTQELREKLFDAVFNGAGVGMFVLDVESDGGYRFVGINRTQELLMGVKNEAVSGRSPSELAYHFGAEVVTRIVALYDRCVQDASSVETLLCMDFPEPGQWWINRLMPLLDERGGVYRIVGTSTNVTAQKQTEDALRESESLLRTILKNSEVAIVLVRPDGVPLVVNRAFERMLGYTSAELAALNFTELTHPEDLDREIRLFREVLEGKRETYTLEKRAIRKDGTTLWSRVSGRAVRNDRDEVTHLVVVGEDITKRKLAEQEKIELEAQYRQSQKMEAVGRLAGGIAHDFNNLLTVITGYADMALDSAAKGDPSRPALKQILEAGEKATGLTGQLLAFGRKQVMAPRNVNLNDGVTDMLKILERTIGETVQLRTNLAADLGTVHADLNQFGQVLMNLAVNSRDAMPEGGVLSISTYNLESGRIPGEDGVLYEGPCVAAAVSDTGVGMSARTMERVFEPFFTTKPKGEGTGLGLATVYGIVRQSRGTVSVESEIGKGTTFRILLPRVEESAGRHRRVRPERTRWPGTETVLVVEDDDTVRELVASMLRSAGYKVTTAANAGEGLLECEKCVGSIDLLLTDIVMPKMTGIELANRVSDLCPDMKVLLMSGYNEQAAMQRSLDRTGRWFIPKPFTSAVLLKKIREILDGEEHASPSLSVD